MEKFKFSPWTTMIVDLMLQDNAFKKKYEGTISNNRD